MKRDIKKDIFSQIQQENITPLSKKIFIWKRILTYIVLILTLIIGSFSFSLMLGYLLQADWDLLQRLWFFKIISIFLPFFWLIFLGISLVLWYREFQNTQRGYKFYLWQIVLGNILISGTVGSMLFVSWISQIGEQKIENFFPQYRNMLVQDKISRMTQVWQNEEKWLLIGEIISSEVWFLTFLDSNEKQWKILLDENTTTDIKHRVSIQAWEKVKIIWKKIDDDIFSAQEIRPYLRKS